MWNTYCARAGNDRGKEVEWTGFIEAFCKRAAIAHQLTNCLTEIRFESALKRAGQLDAYLKTRKHLFGPLHGVPVTVKDSFNVPGLDSSIGIAALAFKPSSSAAPLVALLESLGAVVIAKTNIPQTLAALDSINNVFGRTLNPANRALTAGGSSGGEGVIAAMKGSIFGMGTDVGGSIRIPAMCNGVYGIKPSVGRVPYGGQESGGMQGHTRAGQLQAVAGPISANIEDAIWALDEVAKRAEMWGEDCVPLGQWTSDLKSGQTPNGSGPKGEFVVGMLRSDGNTTPLPPIQTILDEVKSSLTALPNVVVTEISTPPAFTACQSLAVKLMSIDGAKRMKSLISETAEVLIPWLQGRFGGGEPYSVESIRNLVNRRTQIEKDMNSMWYGVDPETGTKKQKLDAVICPVAPHPTPELDRWNAVGYTSSFVLLDWPAGCVPVRHFKEKDLQLGQKMEDPVLGSWDKKNRELCKLMFGSPFHPRGALQTLG
ncbi:MAG: hypothetical protein Q9227_000633 [Pyrenula ochraceoflavens]